VFPLFGWSIGLVFNAWDVYWRKPVSEDRIRQEMERMTYQLPLSWRQRGLVTLLDALEGAA
jgi:hypothetical protein